MDTSELRSAYAALLELARTGDFPPSPDGAGWDARLVVAHVAANDELLIATTRQVLDGTAERYYNHDVIDSERLAARAGTRSLAELADWLQDTSTRVCDLADTVPEDDTALVHVHIEDGGETALDRPAPWHRVLGTQAVRHLPMHTEQLRDLLKA